MKVIDLSGKTFGRLTVIGRNGSYKHKNGSEAKWLCQCSCGNRVTVLSSSLRAGRTQSCGCYMREINTSKATKHNLCGTRIYNIYHNMLARCYNKSNKCYKTYGKRGITVCNEWLKDFQNFAEWAEKSGYQNSLTIERKDVNKGYSPENCIWIQNKDQAKNKTSTHFVIFEGERMCLSELAYRVGISRPTIRKYENQYNYDYDRLVTEILKKKEKKHG